MDSSELKTMFPVGTIVANRYEVVSFIGVLGQSANLHARDKALNNELVSLKVFIQNKDSSETDFLRFKNEVILARRLAHPNILRTYDFGAAGDGCYYLIAEYVEGESLSSFIRAKYGVSELIPEKDCLYLLYELALGLFYAHEQGVVHRDIRPDNIILTKGTAQGPILKIANFGLARSSTEDMGVTRAGEVVGNIHYMSPEQLRCEPLDERVDMYAFGILAFELFTGKKPFDAMDQTSIATMHISTPIPLVSEFRSSVSPSVNSFLQRLAAKRKEDRFCSMQEVLNFISSELGFSSTSLTSVVAKKSSKGKAVFRAAIKPLIGIFLLSLGAFVFVRNIEAIKEYLAIPTQLEEGVVVNQKLLSFVLLGDHQEVFRLLQEGASAKTSDARGVPIASLAARFNQTGVLYTILEHDPEVSNLQDKQGMTPLMHAIEAGRPDAVKLILKYKPDIGIKDGQGKTAKDFARQSPLKEVKNLF